MNTKAVSLSAVVALSVVFAGWFGWTAYQRSVYESAIASAEDVTTKIGNDSEPANLVVLATRQTKIISAISSLNKIPPSSGDIYRKAQERWGELQELKAKVTQMMENEEQASSSLDKAKALNEEIIKNYNSRNLSIDELQISLNKYQEVIFLLEKIPSNTSVAAESKKALNDFRKNGEIILTAYRNKESLARDSAEKQRQQEADKQR